MSYRELRNFTEIMKALGYPRLISLENFRTPNFELVADVLFWLVHRYDPTAELTDDISGDQGVEFVKSVAQIVYNKAHVKINIKQLYKGDGFAVKELLKVSQLLYDALQTDSQEVEVQSMSDVAITAKLKELQESDNLAPKIVDGGAKVYTLLANEDKLKKSRDRALKFIDSLNMTMDSSNDPHEQIQRNIREQINLVEDNIQELSKLTEGLQVDEKDLTAKIDKKKKELIRMEKRYSSVKMARPPFMQEYDLHEEELRHVYDTYLERFRNLHYLESELTKYHTHAMDKKAKSDLALKRMQKRLKDEELKLFRGEQGNRRPVGNVNASGDMYGNSDDDEDLSEVSSDEEPSRVQNTMVADSDSDTPTSSDADTDSDLSSHGGHSLGQSSDSDGDQTGSFGGDDEDGYF